MNEQAAVAWRRALDGVLDDLERRVERREKKLRVAEESVIAQRRGGDASDARAVASYRTEVARYEELRLALNAALRIDKLARKQVQR